MHSALGYSREEIPSYVRTYTYKYPYSCNVASLDGLNCAMKNKKV